MLFCIFFNNFSFLLTKNYQLNPSASEFVPSFSGTSTNNDAYPPPQQQQNYQPRNYYNNYGNSNYKGRNYNPNYNRNQGQSYNPNYKGKNNYHYGNSNDPNVDPFEMEARVSNLLKSCLIKK
jgi:hypothetical protein